MATKRREAPEAYKVPFRDAGMAYAARDFLAPRVD